MNIQKFTQNSVEAINKAQSIAIDNQNSRNRRRTFIACIIRTR